MSYESVVVRKACENNPKKNIPPYFFCTKLYTFFLMNRIFHLSNAFILEPYRYRLAAFFVRQKLFHTIFSCKNSSKMRHLAVSIFNITCFPKNVCIIWFIYFYLWALNLLSKIKTFTKALLILIFANFLMGTTPSSEENISYN